MFDSTASQADSRPVGRSASHPMFDKLFLDHPRDVDETYFEHMQVAGYFGVTMLAAGFACLVHALVPGLFTKTGSKAVRHLYERMVTARHR